jgi:glycogen operon protein
MRNLISTLLLSQGVPMILAGDELGRTQGGNNNAYCQDSEISWVDWDDPSGEGQALLEFTRRLIALRRDHIVFHRSRFFHGQIIPGTEVEDVVWLRPDGVELQDEDWNDPHAKALGVRLSGEAGLMHLTSRGEKEPDDTFLLLVNAAHESVRFRLPEASAEAEWVVVIDTTDDELTEPTSCAARVGLDLPPRSLQLLQLRLPAEE